MHDLFRVLDNQQKEGKILPADIDVKQQWTHGPYNQVIVLFMCREWTEAIMLIRYDFKNSDVKCRAVCSELFTIIICLTLMKHNSSFPWVLIVQVVI